MSDWKAQQAARAVAAAAMQAAYPHLIAVGDQRGKNDSLNAAAKNIRIELKRAYPVIKFSVRTDRYSGGTSINVDWTDGPTTGQVEEIAKKYSGGSFNGMEDIYEYSRDSWTDAFGDAKYVFCNRADSTAAIESAIRTVFARYPSNMAGIERPTAAQFLSGRLYSVIVPGLNDALNVLIRTEAYRRTWALPKATAVTATADQVPA